MKFHLPLTTRLSGQSVTISNFNMKKDQNGFIALISILILSSVLLASTLALAQFGIANRFFILNLEQKSMSSKRAEACVEIARIKAYNNPSYTTSAMSVTIGGGTCTLTSVAVSGNTTTIKATATETVASIRDLGDVATQNGGKLSLTTALDTLVKGASEDRKPFLCGLLENRFAALSVSHLPSCAGVTVSDPLERCQ